MKRRIILLSGLLFLACHNEKTHSEKEATGAKKTVEVWVSTSDEKKNLTRETDVELSQVSDSAYPYTITIDEDITCQKWIGCGACSNDASSFLMYKKLPKETKDSLMRNLFSKSEGIGLDWLRHQMGSGDAAVINNGWWTYDDMPKGQDDPELKHFSIDMEKDYILPTLKEALAINPSLKIIGCPWTPPAWMKTSANDANPLTHGYVQPKYYSSFANYFVRFIQEYAREGIPVYGISMQNEPLAETQPWQACGIPAVTQKELIKNHFIPAFRENNISAKLYVFDHNWDNGWEFIWTLYHDTAVYNFVAGSMWHHYGGLPSMMTLIHNAYPDKEIWFTEAASTTTWEPVIFETFDTYKGSFQNCAYNLINIPRNWSQTIMYYQIAMDPDHGPAVFAPPTNYGMVTIDPKKHSLEYRPEYYVLGHISKFVVPGAVRIESNQYDGEMESVAFKNPDGSIVLVVANRISEKDVRISLKGESFVYKLPAQSLVSFVMK